MSKGKKNKLNRKKFSKARYLAELLQTFGVSEESVVNERLS